MKHFLLTIVIVGAIEVVGALTNLARGKVPETTPQEMAVNAIILGVLGAWAAYLLVNQA